MEEEFKKGTVCITGGTGFVGSWLIMRLLQHGYSVNATIRNDPERKKDVSFLTNLPGASGRLRIFDADLSKPESFEPAIKGCIGLFHVAHPLDFEDKETEETKLKIVTSGLLGILKACLNLKTVKRVVYTSSSSTVLFNGQTDLDIVDESSWTDVELIRSLRLPGGSYIVTKTLTEKTALEFAKKHGLDVVTLVSTWIHGPFICSHLPDSVRIISALIYGDQGSYKFLIDTSLVHVDDVARAHIFLFEHPYAKGRYICSAVDFTIDKLNEYFSTKHPEYQMPNSDSLKDTVPVKFSGLSSKKLREAGFEYKYGLEEIFDGAIESCKRKCFLYSVNKYLIITTTTTIITIIK